LAFSFFQVLDDSVKLRDLAPLLFNRNLKDCGVPVAVVDVSFHVLRAPFIRIPFQFSLEHLLLFGKSLYIAPGGPDAIEAPTSHCLELVDVGLYLLWSW